MGGSPVMGGGRWEPGAFWPLWLQRSHPAAATAPALAHRSEKKLYSGYSMAPSVVLLAGGARPRAKAKHKHIAEGSLLWDALSKIDTKNLPGTCNLPEHTGKK